MIRTTAAAFAAVVSLAAADAGAASAAPADAAKIESRTLANGLKVVVWPDHDIPNVAMYLWFRVGSRNEYPGITGISHFFEHMMFNGTKTRRPGEFDRIMEGNGGRNNAYTSSDVTVYQDWFPRGALELVFDLEADRMRNLDFDPKAVESERGVVYSERRSSVDNDNFGTLVEQIQATAFVAHPYQIPTIGWPSDIEGWTIEDLQTYYQRYYAPNNAVGVRRGRRDGGGSVRARREVLGADQGAARTRAGHHARAAAARRAADQDRARCADAVDRDGLARGFCA